MEGVELHSITKKRKRDKGKEKVVEGKKNDTHNNKRKKKEQENNNEEKREEDDALLALNDIYKSLPSPEKSCEPPQGLRDSVTLYEYQKVMLIISIISCSLPPPFLLSFLFCTTNNKSETKLRDWLKNSVLTEIQKIDLSQRSLAAILARERQPRGRRGGLLCEEMVSHFWPFFSFFNLSSLTCYNFFWCYNFFLNQTPSNTYLF